MEFLNAPLPQSILKQEGNGNFAEALQIVNSLLKKDLPVMLKRRLEYEPERIRRLIEDHPYNEEEAKEKLSSIGVSENESENLLKTGDVDYIIVKGKKKFERRFLENFAFKFPKYKKHDDEREEITNLVNERVDELLNGDKPKRYKVGAEIAVTLTKDRKGEKLRCWLPIPKVGNPVESLDFVKCEGECRISPENSPNRTVYMEGSPKAGTTFKVKFEYVLHEQINHVDPDKVKESHKQVEFLKEKPPHIIFSKYLVNLTKEIVGDEKNPYLKARSIYDWMTRNIAYSYMNPYSIYDGSLAEFAAVNLRGDCGVKALLFITMCRIANIPAKWQSGWFISQKGASPHDWAYFYVEPYGWLPADLSFGGARKDKEERRKFYFGNMDAFRMVANSEFMAPFYPEKKHVRSDPYDNQVGELETKSQNIYYDGFSHEIKVSKFEELGNISEGERN